MQLLQLISLYLIGLASGAHILQKRNTDSDKLLMREDRIEYALSSGINAYAAEYLKQFGYLEGDTSDLNEEELAELIQEPLKLLQAYYGLPETGKILMTLDLTSWLFCHRIYQHHFQP